jgi:hypothetical protein
MTTANRNGPEKNTERGEGSRIGVRAAADRRRSSSTLRWWQGGVVAAFVYAALRCWRWLVRARTKG